MNLAALDFETYWSSNSFTLSDMPVIRYVRDARFETQLLAIARPGYETRCLDMKTTIKRALASIMDDNTMIIGHNLLGFDALIISEVFGMRPKMMADTMLMARWTGLGKYGESHAAITPKLANGMKERGVIISDGMHWPDDFDRAMRESFMAYNKRDAEQCLKNFATLLPHMTADALRLMTIAGRMATEPVFQIDGKGVKAFLKRYDAELKAASEDVRLARGFADADAFVEVLKNDAVFEIMLRDMGVEKDNCQAGEEDSKLALLTRYRERFAGDLRRRAEGMLDMARRPLPVLLSPWGMETGEFTDVNHGRWMDGFGVKGVVTREKYKELRELIRAPEGYKVVLCRVPEQELATLAEEWLSNGDDLAWTASRIVYDLARGNEGRSGGPRGKALTWRWKKVVGVKEPMPVVELPGGFSLKYPELKESDDAAPRILEQVLKAVRCQVNHWQGCMLDMAEVPLKFNLPNGWISCVPDEDVDQVAHKMEGVIGKTPAWMGLKLPVETKTGDSLAIVGED